MNDTLEAGVTGAGKTITNIQQRDYLDDAERLLGVVVGAIDAPTPVLVSRPEEHEQLLTEAGGDRGRKEEKGAPTRPQKTSSAAVPLRRGTERAPTAGRPARPRVGTAVRHASAVMAADLRADTSKTAEHMAKRQAASRAKLETKLSQRLDDLPPDATPPHVAVGRLRMDTGVRHSIATMAADLCADVAKTATHTAERQVDARADLEKKLARRLEVRATHRREPPQSPSSHRRRLYSEYSLRLVECASRREQSHTSTSAHAVEAWWWKGADGGHYGRRRGHHYNCPLSTCQPTYRLSR
jgi:hypothetical protein